jgi:hypothetical protein
MTELSDLHRLPNRQPAVVFEVSYQFTHTHTTLIVEACKGNTVANTAIHPAVDFVWRQIRAGR